ncbi:hypothetical protein [Tsukamurella sp. USMM236]|uniref:hypothetical protein n=1 Tax=Tsukamurella sp. USMM236 TaxID=3081301 RepID=UPI0030172B76
MTDTTDTLDPDTEALRTAIEDVLADAIAIYGPPDEGLPKHLAAVLLRTYTEASEIASEILAGIGVNWTNWRQTGDVA